MANSAGILSIFRRALGQAIGSERYELWFSNEDSLRLIDGTVVVAAADEFSLDWLRRQLRAELQEVYEDVFHRPSQIEFRVDRALKNEAEEQARIDDGALPTEASQNNERKSEKHNDQLPRRRFARLDSFQIGACNRVAYTAAMTAVERLGEASPLFFYGPPGCGKTHLLEGIWSAAKRSRRGAWCLYLTAEQFTSCFLEALHGSGLPSFRRKHRDVQLLLIDDVQFFVGKRATLGELLHTIDTLLRDGRQLVFAADRSPSQLGGLGAELVTRMSGGLVCGIQTPEASVRLGILKQVARRLQLRVPQVVLEMMAERLAGDGRQLTGALHRLRATSQALQSPITLQLAHQTLDDLIQALHPAVRLTDIERAVCDVLGVDEQTLHSGRRTRAVSQPRMLAMWLARKHTRSALTEISEYFGRRSHSTVVSAQRQVETWRSEQARLRCEQGQMSVIEAIEKIEARLRAG